MTNIIWTVVAVQIILWVLGFSINVAGGLVYLLLVLAIIGLIYDLISGRRI